MGEGENRAAARGGRNGFLAAELEKVEEEKDDDDEAVRPVMPKARLGCEEEKWAEDEEDEEVRGLRRKRGDSESIVVVVVMVGAAEPERPFKDGTPATTGGTSRDGAGRGCGCGNCCD
jgi:hypothetical protein